ncbi:MAG: tRNA lysidine(34) synthetase TilS [Pseudobutyrivibrio sp.]|nr:tRNA lysidine(34) synthetase TilS [Pseudobutyrivibrio sp.]
MLTKGDTVVLGLSGGPDSVCLFFVLLALREEYDLSIKAVHINHMIRGEAADSDAEFVDKLCQDNGIECIIYKIDVPSLAKESGRSLEEEARLARYDKFSLYEGAKIAIAHNANDNAETVLFHMARGAGLDGMCGIDPVRGSIIRPLLGVSKERILSYLDENGIGYCVDHTNSQVDYDRNRIRHNVMPELEKINDRALDHIFEMTNRLSEVRDYLRLEANGLLQIAQTEGGGLRKRAFITAPKVVASQALKVYLSKYMPEEKDVSASHIEAILSLLNEDGEKRVDLPYGHTFIISYEEMYMGDDLDENEGNQGEFTYREFDYQKDMAYPTETYTKWFDCARITGDIVIRTRAEGDYLTINDAGDRKLLQDYFIDEKVPKHLRDSIPLVCCGSHVMWVVGYRISSHYKISNNTTRVLEIVYGGN